MRSDRSAAGAPIADAAYDDLFALQSKVRSFVYSQMGRVSEQEIRPVIEALDRIAAFAELRVPDRSAAAPSTDEAYVPSNAFRECTEHTPPPTIKWGIASGERWCAECKKFIRLIIDMDGHP